MNSFKLNKTINNNNKNKMKLNMTKMKINNHFKIQ
jgi:hypothetical protein